MEFRIEVSSPWFEFIRAQLKTIEGRKGTPRWLEIKPGMIGQIIHPETKENFSVECLKVERYLTIEEYLKTESLALTLPGVKTIEEGIGIYSQWSTPNEIKIYGFLGIHIRKI